MRMIRRSKLAVRLIRRVRLMRRVQLAVRLTGTEGRLGLRVVWYSNFSAGLWELAYRTAAGMQVAMREWKKARQAVDELFAKCDKGASSRPDPPPSRAHAPRSSSG